MPGYIEVALKRLQYIPSKHPQYSPHFHQPIKYSAKGTRQHTSSPDISPLLSPKDTKYIQSVVGSYLYHARALDTSLLPAINEISRYQSQPTFDTKQKCQRLMDYVNTYKNVSIIYHASDMVLHVDSDAAYLVAPKARSHIASYYYVSNHPTKVKHPTRNGAVLIECNTLRQVVSSAAEAETAGLFYAARTEVPIRQFLIHLRHHQPPTPLKSDDSTSYGFAQQNIQQRKSKSWDMQFHWLRNREFQKILLF